MKKVSILVPEGTAVVAVTGPLDILMQAGKYWMSLDHSRKKPFFEIELVSLGRAPVKSLSEYLITCNTWVEKVKKTNLILIPSLPGEYRKQIKSNAKFIKLMQDQYKKGAEIASFCTGSFLLAATGLLKGKKASTHWMASREFRELFPDVELVSDKIIVDEGRLYSSGGAVSFLNLTLYLIEKYCGRETAIFISKSMLIDMQKAPQNAYAIFSGQKDHNDEIILKVQLYIENNTEKKLSIDDLASVAFLSRRSLIRRFINATGNSPKEYIQRAKVEEARRMLEFGNETMQEIFNKVGYDDHVTFRKIFKKYTGLLPSEYRNKFIQPVELSRI
jgi:transcriptional regulator GlxA family with amidase domain